MAKNEYPTVTLTEILKWKRPHNSTENYLFCKKYLEPAMGNPDEHGNYIAIIYNKDGTFPEVCFTAHHDTVHREGGIQLLSVEDNLIKALGSNCLGADCGTGVWLILGMIEANVPGMYIIFSGEEVGCIGSSAMAVSKPYWTPSIKAMISFDRKGYSSVITHQLGGRTCSDEFANSLADILYDASHGDVEMATDDGGAYTDSNEFIDLIGECTNISVGYFDQHTSRESQDVAFAYNLLEALISADWSALKFKREPGEIDPADYNYKSYSNTNGYWSNRDVDLWDDPYYSVQTTYGGTKASLNVENLEDLITNFPLQVAQLLDEWGVDAEYLHEQINPYVSKTYSNRKLG